MKLPAEYSKYSRRIPIWG